MANLLWTFCASACSCDGGIIDCSYASANAVFRGTVDFNNDDRTGTFVQQTFVRFQVSEVFKGLSPGTKQVWIDPGSFTSCYAQYRSGSDYLVFAGAPIVMSANYAAKTMARGGKSSKPLPKDLASSNSRKIYSAPECMGTRETHYPDFHRDIVTLRRYAAGAAVPSVVGQILLAPNEPWSGKGRIEGVEVLLETGKGIWHSTTNSEGKFFFSEPLEEGSYTVIARHPGTETERSVLHVYSRSCSHIFLFMRTIRQPGER